MSILPLTTIFNSNGDYMKLAYSKTVTVSRPASTGYIEYTYPIEYADTGFNPMVLGYFTLNGFSQNCKAGLYSTPPGFLGTPNMAVVALVVENNNIIIQVYGSPAVPTAFDVEVTYFVFMNTLE